MTKRWITGILLFALGCCSSFVVRLAAAAAASPREGNVERLHYVDGASDFTLTYPTGNTSGAAYLVMATRKPGTPQPAAVQAAYLTGSLAVAKKGLQSVTIFRVTPLGVWQDGYRPCHNLSDCPVPRPLPRPPSPIKPEPSFIFPAGVAPGQEPATFP
jgi:hypothetical protein